MANVKIPLQDNIYFNLIQLKIRTNFTYKKILDSFIDYTVTLVINHHLGKNIFLKLKLIISYLK